MFLRKIFLTIKNITSYIITTMTLIAIAVGIAGVSMQSWKLFTEKSLGEGLLSLGQWTTYLVILIGIYQYGRDTKSKRREAVLTEANSMIDDAANIKVKLNEKVNFSSYSEANMTISRHEIHNWICISDGQGSFKKDPNNGQFEMSTDGRTIQSYIRAIINSYETLSLGVFLGIYDEETSKRLFRGLILKNWNIFKDYITHRRETPNNEKFGEYFEELSDRWKERKRPAPNS